MLKKSISVLLSLIMIFGVFTIIPFPAFAMASGTTGDCTWVLDDDGVLTISGNGKMGDYGLVSDTKRAPWFSSRKSIYKLIINDGVKDIGKDTFTDCSNLSSVTIPESVTCIDNDALRECIALTSIDIPDSVINIGDRAFYECTGLTVMKIPDSVISIGDGAFMHCYRIKSLTISNKVMTIGEWAFSDCSALTSVTIPDTVTNIGRGAFSWSIGLTSVNIGSSVTKIYGDTFYGCDYLRSIYIPRSVKSIEEGAFIAFNGSMKLSEGDVYYGGSEDEWETVFKGDDNDCMLEAAIHYNSLCGDDGKFPVLDERVYYDLKWYANYWNSTEYNPELAHLMMTMANSAYNPNNAYQGYSDLGMTSWIPVNYDKTGSVYGTENVCFNIGSVDYDGTICVLVALRGSGDIKDIRQGTLDWLGNLSVESALQTDYSPHKNFNSAAQHVYDALNIYLDKIHGKYIGSSNIKYFVTGHSRGGAVANLLEYKLEPMVGKQNLFAYNFAVPDTAKISRQTNVEGFDNIFNISNLQDPVSYVPGHLVDTMTSLPQWLASGRVDNIWRKWGRSIWFSDGDGVIDAGAHDYVRYLDFMRCRKEISTFTENPKFHVEEITSGWGPFIKVSYKIYATYCPVDVELVDGNGKVIASIIDGVVDYHDSHFGEVIVTTVDDHKIFAVPSDKNYTLCIVGSDTGTLDYYVAETNLISEEVTAIKSFENVALTNGKEMIGKNVNVLDEETKTLSQDEKLIAVGDTPNEILSNGEEVAYSVRYILGDADNNGIIEAVDTALLQRKLADIETEYSDEVLQQGDADGNGELDLPDVTAIQYYLAKMKTPYLIGADVV